MFLGEYNHSIDAKGRVIVPSKFRLQLGEHFIVTKGLDRCLWIFPENEWNEFSGKLHSLPTTTNKNARDFERFFMSGANEASCDGMGRILLPAALREYANLEKDVKLIGDGSRIEIWSAKLWDENPMFSDMDAIAEKLDELGFVI